MKRFFRSKLFKFGLASLGLLVLAMIGLATPNSSLGHIVFHTGYAFPSTRPIFLNFYQKRLDGKGLPRDLDQFLISRLVDCHGSREEQAIIDFQIRQGSGRRGGAAIGAHEITQGYIIANIVERFDTMPDTEVVSALLFIESLRREKMIFKGMLEGMLDYNPDAAEIDGAVLEEAKAKFKEWWADGNYWPEIRAVDPLADSELEIGEAY